MFRKETPVGKAPANSPYFTRHLRYGTSIDNIGRYRLSCWTEICCTAKDSSCKDSGTSDMKGEEAKW